MSVWVSNLEQNLCFDDVSEAAGCRQILRWKMRQRPKGSTLQGAGPGPVRD